jgi:DNA (cytosine-5)-methyltransferase 1
VSIKRPITLGSLFDGIGGFPYAGSFYGIQPVWASEILPQAVSVTRRHFPHMTHMGDVTKLNGGLLPPVDIITFGSPCQDYAEEIVIPRFKSLPLYKKSLRAKTSG